MTPRAGVESNLDDKKFIFLANEGIVSGLPIMHGLQGCVSFSSDIQDLTNHLILL